MGFLSVEATAQHPIYGISRKNIVRRLTARNWQKKAVVRVSIPDAALSYYLWLRDFGEDEDRYRVCCVPDHKSHSYECAFNALDEALAYINGSATDTRLAQETRPATSDEFPPDRAPVSLIRGISRPI